MDFSENAIQTGIKASDINIDGLSDATITVLAYAESFDNEGLYEIGDTSSK